MVADRLLALSLIAASVFPAPALPAPAAEAAQPFTVQDLVRLERISEPGVAPDGKRIAYTLRTTDMEANKTRTGIWLLDTRKRNAQPVRLTDLAANAGSAEWSADGNSLYYLSDRSGSVWRSTARASRTARPSSSASGLTATFPANPSEDARISRSVPMGARSHSRCARSAWANHGPPTSISIWSQPTAAEPRKT